MTSGSFNNIAITESNNLLLKILNAVIWLRWSYIESSHLHSTVNKQK